MRIPDILLQSVFYLYPSRVDADNRRRVGGTGFIVGVPLCAPIGGCYRPCDIYYYAVTNRHVIESGGSVIRLNSRGLDSHVLDLRPSDWVCSDTEDLAIHDIALDPFKVAFTCVSEDLFLTEEIVKQYEIGPGTEVFMLGRFLGVDDSERVQVSARFGRLSIGFPEPVKQSDNHLQPSLLVEMHSLPGYSGSPAFVYVSRYTPGTANLGQYDWKVWLLGVDWGHVPQTYKVLDSEGRETGQYIKANSGLAGVVPSWKIWELLQREDIVELRQKALSQS